MPGLHRVGGEQHLGHEQDAVAEVDADDAHALDERLVEHVVRRPSRGRAGAACPRRSRRRGRRRGRRASGATRSSSASAARSMTSSVPSSVPVVAHRSRSRFSTMRIGSASWKGYRDGPPGGVRRDRRAVGRPRVRGAARGGDRRRRRERHRAAHRPRGEHDGAAARHARGAGRGHAGGSRPHATASARRSPTSRRPPIRPRGWWAGRAPTSRCSSPTSASRPASRSRPATGRCSTWTRSTVTRT